MARTIEVKRVGMKKYDNSLHVRYHSEIYGIVKQYDLTKIGLTTALMDEWNGDINLEGDINKEAGMNVNTERMLKKDEERGKLITFIFNAIRNARQSPDDNESDAAMTLYTVIRSYDGLQQEAHERTRTQFQHLGRGEHHLERLHHRRQRGAVHDHRRAGQGRRDLCRAWRIHVRQLHRADGLWR